MLFANSNAIHSERFLQMLLGAGHTVTYVDQYNTKLRKDGDCTYVPYPNPYQILWLNRIRPYKFQKFLSRWLKAFSFRLIWYQCKPDIVHVHGIGNSAYFCSLARLAPLILTALGSEINDIFTNEANYSGMANNMAKILNSADHITADTQEVLDRCEILVGKQLSKSLYYYGIDLDVFKPLPKAETLGLRKKLGISPDAKVILSMRRLIPKMNHDLVLRAFKDVLDSTNLELVLVFREVLDRDEFYVTELKRLAVELGVSKRVVWMGEVNYEQMALIYNFADLVVNIPHQDGLPVSLFEAAACMKPVITSNLKSYQHFLITDGFFKVPPENVPILAKTIKRIFLDKKLDIASRLNCSYALISEKAEQKICFAGMQLIYRDLISGNTKI